MKKTRGRRVKRRRVKPPDPQMSAVLITHGSLLNTNYINDKTHSSAFSGEADAIKGSKVARRVFPLVLAQSAKKDCRKLLTYAY